MFLFIVSSTTGSFGQHILIFCCRKRSSSYPCVSLLYVQVSFSYSENDFSFFTILCYYRKQSYNIVC